MSSRVKLLYDMHVLSMVVQIPGGSHTLTATTAWQSQAVTPRQLRIGSYTFSSYTGLLQGADGTIELQSAGLPLPDHPLRWLTPLARPSLPVDPTGDAHLSLAADTVMQDTPSPVLSDPMQAPPQQPAPQVSHTIKQEDPSQQGAQQPEFPPSQQASSPTNLQEQAQSGAAGSGPSGVLPMQIDAPQHALTGPALQSGSDNRQELQAASQQQTLPQTLPPLQMITVPEGMQQLVSASVTRCDQQLLSRQEEVLVRLVQQRVGEEVRAVQGVEDVDHPADDLVQKVSGPLQMCIMFWKTSCKGACTEFGLWQAGARNSFHQPFQEMLLTFPLLVPLCVCNQGSGW